MATAETVTSTYQMDMAGDARAEVERPDVSLVEPVRTPRWGKAIAGALLVIHAARRRSFKTAFTGLIGAWMVARGLRGQPPRRARYRSISTSST